MKSAATRQMTRCFVLCIVPCCLPQPKMHSIIRRRDCGMPQPWWRVVRSSMAPVALASFGNAVVLRHMRRDVEGAKIGHMIGRVIGFVLTGSDAVTLALIFSIPSEARRSAVPLARVSMPANAGSPRWAHVGELCHPPGGLCEGDCRDH
jgi:hypothetical protein